MSWKFRAYGSDLRKDATKMPLTLNLDAVRNSRCMRAAVLIFMLASLLFFAGGSAVASSTVSLIVQAQNGTRAAIDAIVDAGGAVKDRLDLIGGAIADIPENSIDRLAADSRVSVLSPNYSLEFQSDSFGGALESAYPEAINATSLWNDGIDGRGVGIALLDTGIADHPDLDGRVVASADLTSEGSFTDSYGHGTFMAGLIAGDGTASGGKFVGVAPAAHLISIKVAGGDGVTTLGQVLYGLQLIDASRHRFGTRVVVIALAGPPHEGPDPLEMALERLWADGLVVVTAAGNSGPDQDTVASPGVDPYVITVGAYADAGTIDSNDDSLPEWTARGASDVAKPDFVAPGVSVISTRSTGSTVDEENPSARVDEEYFRGSGTSMSAAVAAGAAALSIEASPESSPNETKGRLLGGAKDAPSDWDAYAVGSGLLDVHSAAYGDHSPSNGDLPNLKGEHANYPADSGDEDSSFEWNRGNGRQFRWLGKYWAGRYWAGKYWAGKYWAEKDWSGRYWAESDWAGKYWAGKYWAGKYWAGKYWAGKYWAGKYWAGKYWSGKYWAGEDWSGKYWSGKYWSGKYWSGRYWSGRYWSAASWD